MLSDMVKENFRHDRWDCVTNLHPRTERIELVFQWEALQTRQLPYRE